jgi:uncharacterized protein
MAFSGKSTAMLSRIAVLVFIGSACLTHAQDPKGGKPLLIKLIDDGRVVEARKLIDSGSKINVYDRFGNNAISAAVLHQETELALELLKAGADPSFTCPTCKARPLTDAALQCDFRVSQALLDRGFSSNEATDDNYSALMLAAGSCADGRLVGLLLEKGAEPNAVEEIRGLTPLMIAADNGNAEAVETLLNSGADPKAQSHKGKSVAEYACDSGSARGSQVCDLVRRALGSLNQGLSLNHSSK